MTMQTDSQAKLEPHISSPQELACELNNTLRFQQEQRLLHVSGIFCDKRRQKIYGGFAYDALLDFTSEHSLTMIVPIKLKERLRDGRAYVFRGYLQRKISNSDLNIEVAFRVSGVENFDIPSFEEALVSRSDVFHTKCSRGFRRVESLILERLRAGNPVRITLVHGIDAVVDEDVQSRLSGLSAYYEIKWRAVSLSDKSAIIAVLKELDAQGTSDIIGVIRGGGKLAIFNDVDIASAAAGLNTPFITAIGHEVDRHLCDYIADKDFGTPTAIGMFLKKMVEQAEEESARERWLTERSRKLEAKETALSKRENQLLQKLIVEPQPSPTDRKESDPPVRMRPNWRLTILYITAGVIIGVVIGILIAKGTSWPGSNSNSGINQNLQMQPTPAASATLNPPPVGDSRRKHK